MTARAEQPGQDPRDRSTGTSSQNEHASSRQEDARQRVLAQLEEQKADLQEEIKNSFADHTRIAQIGERAYAEVQTNLPNAHLARLEQIFRQHREELNQASVTQLDQLYEAITKQANDYVKVVKALTNTIARENGDVIFNEKETHELGIILKQADQLSKEKPELVQLLEKLSERRNLESEADGDPERLKKIPPLTADDYGKIISLMDLRTIRRSLDPVVKPGPRAPSQSLSDHFMETTFGAIVTLLKPGERFKLIETMLHGSRQNDAPEAIDLLTSLDLLTLQQSRELFTEVQKEKPAVLDPQKFRDYMQKIDQEYPAAQERERAAVRQVVEVGQSQFATNELERFCSMEGLGELLKIHSIVWMAGQFLAMHGDIKEFLFHPITLAAGAEFIVGRTMAEHGGTIGAPYGGLAAIIDWFKDDEGPKNKEEADAFNDLGDLYSHHLAFADYLQQGGAGHLLDLKNKADRENKGKNPKPITYDQLLQYEQNLDVGRPKLASGHSAQNLSESLQKAQGYESGLNPQNKATMDGLIQKFVKAADMLHLSNQNSYAAKINLIKKAQGMKPGPHTAPTSAK